MIMNLGSEEIYEAIQHWIKGQGISVRNKTVEIEIKSGRKGNGPSAIVKIEAIDETLPLSSPSTDMSQFELGDLS